MGHLRKIVALLLEMDPLSYGRLLAIEGSSSVVPPSLLDEVINVALVASKAAIAAAAIAAIAMA